MKCIVLAGGTGDRLWPLSRDNYPKQFIPIRGTHSLFQETIARNLPFCDEFIILANKEHRFIIQNQMKAFQGVTYKCIFETVRKKTAPIVALACLGLSDSELVLLVPADSIVTGNNEYRESILEGLDYAKQNNLVTFGIEQHIDDVSKVADRYGFIIKKENEVVSFKEKPGKLDVWNYIESGTGTVNSGMFMFKSELFLSKIEQTVPELYELCRNAYKNRLVEGSDIYYREEFLNSIEALSIEKAILEKDISSTKFVNISFGWEDINSFADLKPIQNEVINSGLLIEKDTTNLKVVNTECNKLVACSGLNDVTIINTPDVLFIGNDESASELKDLVDEKNLANSFSNSGTIYHRQWGEYDILSEDKDFRVKRIVVTPGRTVYMHSHDYRNEHITVLQGKALVTINDQSDTYIKGSCIVIPRGCNHQISNVGNENLICIEVDSGDIHNLKDTYSFAINDLSESSLGYEIEPIVKLSPAYKDYIWGGTKLTDKYNKKCDLERLAESWEISSHPAGQSVVSSGKHSGMFLGDYLRLVGMDSLGWKGGSRDEFPLLIKLIDAKNNLSVQVHPNDEYALENEHEYGKNEMWYILEAEPDASIYCGFNRDVTPKLVKESLANGTIESLLNCIPVKKGDVFFIEAGTVHAIRAGVVICEIQQNSNTTYRLYDYDRTDSSGKKRELHIDKALDVLNYNKYFQQESFPENANCVEESSTVLASCKYFEVARHRVNKLLELTTPDESFWAIVCVDGNGEIHTKGCEKNKEKFITGDSFIVIKPGTELVINGDCEIITAFV